MDLFDGSIDSWCECLTVDRRIGVVKVAAQGYGL